MNSNDSPARAAATLVYKGLQPKLVVSRDKEYRELIAHYESDATFRSTVQDIAIGMGLLTLAVSPQGAFFAPASADSRFAMRLGDVRATTMTQEEKALMVLVHAAAGALFYPTAERLNDDSYSPAGVLESEVLSLLKTLCVRIAKQAAEHQDLPKELEPGWQCVLGKPESRPEAKKQTIGTLEGMVSAVVKQLCEHGFLYPESGEEPVRYLATWKYTVQLRELLVSRIFQAAQSAAEHHTQARHA